MTDDLNAEPESPSNKPESPSNKNDSLMLLAAYEEFLEGIGGNIHHSVGQNLAALRIGLSLLRQDMPANETLLTRLAGLEDMAAKIAGELHDLSSEVSFILPASAGLQAALSAYVQFWTSQSGCAAEFQSSLEGEISFGPALNANICRILQEALSNISKHAQASHVDVIFNKQKNNLILVIEDNGCGFDPHKAVEAGSGKSRSGFATMKARAAFINGDITVESQLGAGTTIIVRLPYPEPDDLGHRPRPRRQL